MMAATWSEYAEDVSYLKMGGDRPRAAYLTLTELDLFCVLADFDPVLTGTFPLGLELDESELDLICYAPNLDQLAAVLVQVYGMYEDFTLEQSNADHGPSLECHFRYGEFRIGVLGEPAPSREQNAFRHLVAQSRLLRLAGPSAAEAIRRLKASGLATAPAFGEYFRLGSDPNRALLDLADAPAEELDEVITRSAHHRY
jgi:hypothetical protein